MKRQRRQGTREEGSSEAAYWRVLGTLRRARTESRSSRPEFVRSARVWHLWATGCVYFTGAPPSGRCLTGNDTEIILDFIDPLSCIPPPTTLLSTIFGRGAGSWHSPRTQDFVKCKKTSYRFGSLQFVCAHRRACATIPRLTLFCTIPRCSAHFRRFWVSKRLQCENLLNNTKTIFFSIGLTPVTGPIFETKNPAIFLERFFWRGITAREQLSRAKNSLDFFK